MIIYENWKSFFPIGRKSNNLEESTASMSNYRLFQELTRTEAKNLGPQAVLLFPGGCDRATWPASAGGNGSLCH